MGFFKSIGKAFKSIGKGLGSIAKGVVKFAKSPFGKLLINVGLSFVTGGMGGLLAKGLGMLGNMGKFGSMLSTFGGFASKFLGSAQSLLSGNGLGAIGSFLKNAGSSGDLLSMAKSLFSAQQSQPAASKPDTTTEQIIQQNLKNMFAQRQAQLLAAQ